MVILTICAGNLVQYLIMRYFTDRIESAEVPGNAGIVLPAGTFFDVFTINECPACLQIRFL